MEESGAPLCPVSDVQIARDDLELVLAEHRGAVAIAIVNVHTELRHLRDALEAQDPRPAQMALSRVESALAYVGALACGEFNASASIADAFTPTLDRLVANQRRSA